MLHPGTSVVPHRGRTQVAPAHSPRPHLLLLVLANLVLLGSSLLTRNRDLMFSVALVACVAMTLTYLFIWKRMARN